MDRCLYDYYDDIFFEYLANIDTCYRKKLPDYRKLVDKEESILDKYPKLRSMLDEEVATDLSKEETEQLINLLIIRDKKAKMYTKLIFFKGGNEAYHLLKKWI